MGVSYLEKTLIEWAIDWSYALQKEQYSDELNFELELSKEINPILVEEHEPQLITPNLSHLVYTPTGALRYFAFVAFEDSLGEEETRERILEDIERYGSPHEGLVFHHGAKINNWRSEQIPLEERLNNAELAVLFIPTNPDWICSKDFTSMILFEGKGKSPIYNFLKKGFYQNKSFATIKTEGLVESINKGKPWMPRNEQSYRKILDFYSELIEKE